MPLHRLIAVILCCSITGCATGARYPAQTVPRDGAAGGTVLAEYAQKLPLGSLVKVERATGPTVRGTLMKATGELVVVQPSTRRPVPPVEVPLGDVVRITPDKGGRGTIARAIGLGAAAGTAAALGVFAILVAIYSD